MKELARYGHADIELPDIVLIEDDDGNTFWSVDEASLRDLIEKRAEQKYLTRLLREGIPE